MTRVLILSHQHVYLAYQRVRILKLGCDGFLRHIYPVIQNMIEPSEPPVASNLSW